jgi:hypothetical protein
MPKKISRKEEILARLEKEGKIVRLDKDADQASMLEMNERLKEIRRDYQIKERESQAASAKIILNS